MCLFISDLRPECVEDGHVVGLHHELVLHEAQHRQRVPEQHLHKQ